MIEDVDTNEDKFKKKFISLLISQRERTLAGNKQPERKGGFRSVGEILASEEFINHTKKKWKL